jgi:hypothetical protein
MEVPCGTLGTIIYNLWCGVVLVVCMPTPLPRMQGGCLPAGVGGSPMLQGWCCDAAKIRVSNATAVL